MSVGLQQHSNNGMGLAQELASRKRFNKYIWICKHLHMYLNAFKQTTAQVRFRSLRPWKRLCSSENVKKYCQLQYVITWSGNVLTFTLVNNSMLRCLLSLRNQHRHHIPQAFPGISFPCILYNSISDCHVSITRHFPCRAVHGLCFQATLWLRRSPIFGSVTILN